MLAVDLIKWLNNSNFREPPDNQARKAHLMPIHPHTFENQGPLYLLTGPAGSGKTTVLKRLLLANKHLHESVSYTTRWPARPGEIDHRDYHFQDIERFLWMTVTDQFVETTLIHGNYYGTSAYELEMHWARDGAVVIAVDCHGVDNYFDLHMEPKAVFLDCTDEDEIRRRLRNSDRKESDEEIEKRVRKGREEREWAMQAYADGRVLYVPDMSVDDSLRATADYFGLKAAWPPTSPGALLVCRGSTYFKELI